MPDTAELAEILDVVELERAVAVASPLTLYDRWEAAPWSVAEVDPAADLPRWRRLPLFLRSQLRAVLEELGTGEACVTETLTPLIDHAPDEQMRIFLATQIADEARHVRFIRAYTCDVIVASDDVVTGDGDEDSFARHFEPLLRRRTAAVREAAGDLGAWCEGVAPYHLVTEGILAATALRSTLQIVRRDDLLPALAAGLVHIARDESRHVQFGVGAAQYAIAEGHGDRLFSAFLDTLPACCRVLVDPAEPVELPELAGAAHFHRRRLAGQAAFARTKMRRVLSAIGGRHLLGEAEAVWDGAIAAAASEYRERFAADHPAVPSMSSQQNESTG